MNKVSQVDPSRERRDAHRRNMTGDKMYLIISVPGLRWSYRLQAGCLESWLES